jgi:hypothetical protein
VTVWGIKFLFVAETQKCVEISVSKKHDITATATITAIWATLVDILLMAKTDRTIAAISSLNLYFYLVYKHILVLLYRKPPRIDRGGFLFRCE